MLIDFDGLTIIIGIVIYILICIFIHKKYKKEKIYYVFSTIMFCYFMCIAKLTLFPIVMIGLPANIRRVWSKERESGRQRTAGDCHWNGLF